MILETVARTEYATVAAVGVATVAVIYITYKLSGKNAVKGGPVNLRSLPIVGSRPFIPSNPAEYHTFFFKKAQEIGPVIGFYAGSQYVVVLNGREAIQEALVKRSLDFADHMPMFAEKLVWNPQLRGLISKRYGEQYNKNRHISMTLLKEFGLGNPRVLESRIHMELETLLKSLADLKGQALYPKELISLFLLNVISGMLLSHRFEKVDSTLRDFISQATQFLGHLDPALELSPSVRTQPKYQNLIAEMPEVKAKLMGTVKVLVGVGLGKDGEENFVRNYVEKEGKKYDVEELEYIVRDIANGGMQTTGIQLLWAVVLLGNNPKVQEKMKQEIDLVVPKDRLPSMDDKKGLPYVEACMLEIFRTRGLLPFVFPHGTTCDTEVLGCKIPQSTMVMVNMYSIHMDENVWKKPEEFNPDRFLDSNGSVINRDQVVAFSLGKRSCPGEEMGRQELFLFIAGLVQRFQILPPEGEARVRDEQVVVRFLQPAEFKVRFKARA